MTVIECLEEISITDSKYTNQGEKNFYLIQKFIELIAFIKNDDIKELKDKIIEQYSDNMYLSFCECVCGMSGDNTSSVKVKTTNIIDFYNAYDENLIRYIKGHMFLEFAMNTIIAKSLNISTEKKTFAKKIDLLFKNSLISENEKNLLKAINKQRNEIAHNLNYTLTFDTMYNLITLSANAGVDYSDNTIYENKGLSKEEYEVEGIITELFPNTFCHLFYENEKFFEDNEIFNYMF